MDRKEVRTIIRRMLTPDENVLVADYELNSMIRQGLIELFTELGGELYEEDVTTDADGYGDLTDLTNELLRIVRVELDGVRVNRISLDEIYDTSQEAT